MKGLTKRIFLMLSSVLCSVCLLLGGVFAFSQTTRANAADLASEFTNNGQFTVSKYNGAVPFEYVDGGAEGLPAGYSGSVMKITTTSGLAYATLDFSASQIKASDVESVVVRMYSPGYTAADEFRTNVAADGSQQVLYGAGAHDMSAWCDITLNATSMVTMTDANGYLALVSVGARVKGGATVYYIDSVTVNMKRNLETEFTNDGQFAVSYYTGNAAYVYEFVDGTGLPAGYDGSVLRIVSKTTGGAAYVNLDFTASKINAANVVSVVARVYSPDYTAEDELRINNVTSSLGGAGAHDLSTWCDVELPLNLITGADGNLGSFGFGLRDKGTTSDYFYIDSITVTMKEEVVVETTKVTLTGVHSYWNNYVHDNKYCSILEFSGGIQKGNLLADYSDVFAKATIDGQPVDSTNLSFICRAWIDGGKDSIVMRWVTLPAAGAVLHIPAGATFVNGSEDSNLYEIAEDIYLKFNGATWVKGSAPVVENYGTPTFGPATDLLVGAWGWNHQTTNTGVIKDTNYGYTIIADWAITNNDQNLAAINCLASKSIKLNGVSFYELYQADDGYRLNAQLGYFAFSVPTAALVASNGYEYPTLEIVNGTPFYEGNYLPETTLIYKNGGWKLQTAADLPAPALNFVTLDAGFNNDAHGFLVVQFDTAAWSQGTIATSYTGIYFNGNDISELIHANGGLKSYLEHSLWFSYPPNDAKLVAGYNGYSHPTITIEEGAEVVFNDKTYTFHAVSFYLNFTTNKWQTEVPDGYEIKKEEVVIPELGTPDCVFIGIGVWNNENGTTLFEFRNFVNKPMTTESYKATTGYYITLNGERLSETPNTNVYTWEDAYWLRIDIANPTEGDILIVEEGAPFAGNYLPKMIFKFVNGLWCQAFTLHIEMNGETYTVYSQNDVPVILNDVYFENLLAQKEIPAKVVSFTTRGVTYKAGTTFKALTDTTVTVQTIAFNTTEGASVRTKTPSGIRYETQIDKAEYDALIARYGEANVELGTYIVPRSMLDTDFRTYFANIAKIDGTDYVKIVNSGFANKDTAETDGYYLYYGSLVNIQSANYGTEFFGIGYIQITDGNEVYTVYGGYDLDTYTRSIYYVAAHAYNDYEADSDEKKVLKSYLDSVVYIENGVVISTVIDVDGYVSPYSVAYDAQTGVYTVTGNAEIKSVIFGGEKRISSRTSTLQVNGKTNYVTDYNLNATATFSTFTFKLSTVVDPLSLVDFTLEVPSNRGVKILQLTDTELTDATQMRTASALSATKKEEYARKNVYANCFNYITELVENDRPDLIILTGDIVNGSFDDNGSMWLKIIAFMDTLGIPWAPVFGSLENASAKGTQWQREQLTLAKNCLFKTGDVSGNGDYTIAITDNGVLRRVIFMLNSNADAGVTRTQVEWVKGVSSEVETHYGEVPAFVFCNQNSAMDYAADFAAANVDGVFMGNAPSNNSTIDVSGVSYTYGTKTGSYGEYSETKLGGTYIAVTANGLQFTVSAECLDKTMMEKKEMIRLVETYDGSSVVTDAYLAPIWDTDRIYDETGLFVGETGSVTLMYTPADPKEVVIRDITLGVTYTYGLDYTISGNKVTRVAGGSLPYMDYDEYYRETPVVVSGVPQNWGVTTVNGKTEDGYRLNGTRYMYYEEAANGVARYVTFTYNKTQAWSGTAITGDAKAQSFLNKVKTDKEATIMFYGDSITVGCNASGTSYGGNRNPFLPSWDELVCDTLGKLYGAKINKYNGAVGGWTTAQGAENLEARTAAAGTTLANVDLLVLAFGMNDPQTAESSYIASIKQMINAYYAANPNGSVLLVSPMQPNTQSSMVSGNQKLWENALKTVKNSSEYSGKNVALARVFTVFNELLTVSGKLSRDYLGNNINHPTDFGVRIYAQVILKTLCGDDFG